MIGKNFSQHFELFFLIFPRKQALTFHANCLLRKQFASNVKPVFGEQIKKNDIHLSSAEFVFFQLQVDLDTDTAIVLGMGNVALDVARILLMPIDLLAVSMLYSCLTIFTLRIQT